MSKIVNRFKTVFGELIEQSGLGIVGVAREMKVSRYMLYKWLHVAKDMRLPSLVKIADYFDCSLEYLCGKADVRLEYVPQPLPEFSSRLREVLREKNMSAYRMFRETNIVSTQLHQWTHGITPALNTLEKIAVCLSVTLDYLVGRDR